MNVKKQILSIALLTCVALSANNKPKASFVRNAIITDVENSLAFFIPQDNKEVYVFVADENKRVFQKIKIYQRGNGIIYTDKSGLAPGTYYYTLSVDGVLEDSQKAVIK